MTGSRIRKLLLDIRGGFWLRPLALLLTGVAIGYLATTVDQWLTDTGRASPFDSTASPGGARAVLSAAAGALATTLAISLSLTMVTVQLASSQYTPRLMRRFLSDRFTQRILGAFLATIAYAFMVLRAVRSPEEGSASVPVLSLALAVVLTLGCLGLLVVFLHRTMRSMQASTIIAVVGRESTNVIARHPAKALRPATVPDHVPRACVRATRPGYVQLVDDDRVRCLLDKLPPGSLIWRDAGPGTFIIPGEPLLTVYGCAAVDEETASKLRACFTLGSERTSDSDVGFGIRQLVDMALKALSPGINDVTTAVMVVNELGVLTGVIMEHAPTEGAWRLLDEDDATATPYAVRTLDLVTYLTLAFDEVLHAARDQPRVRSRISEILAGFAEQQTCGHDVLCRLSSRLQAS